MSIISYFPTANRLKQFAKLGDVIAVDDLHTTSTGTTASYYSGSHILSTTSYTFSSLSRKLKAAYLPECVTVGYSTFNAQYYLTQVSLPKCEYVGSHAFAQCSSLQTIDLPLCVTIGLGAFRDTNLSRISAPLCQTISGATTSTSATFRDAPLSMVSFPKLTAITGSYVFDTCTQLMSVYLMNSVVCTLSHSSAFLRTPIALSTYTGAFGSIYVPASLLASYKTAAQWSYFSARLVGI